MVVVNPGRRLLWVLVPHVDPATNVKRHAFYREVRRVLGLPPRRRLKADRLAGALRDVGERRRLRQCYEQIISGGSGRRHNRVSMSLYSGPAQSAEDVRWWRYAAMAQSEHWPVWRLPTVPPDYLASEQSAVGWIGTGDASLNLPKVRTAWKRSFDPFDHHIATLLLPHHGSRRSFDASLLDWPYLTLAPPYATASTRVSTFSPSPRHRPRGAVLRPSPMVLPGFGRPSAFTRRLHMSGQASCLCSRGYFPPCAMWGRSASMALPSFVGIGTINDESFDVFWKCVSTLEEGS